MRTRLPALLAVTWLSVAGLDTALAQSIASGTIHGTIKDESGGALPGVTATLTSRSLQVPELTTASDAQGSYRFVDLPAGTYRLKLELGGFATVIREDLRLTVGFVARIDATMSVGGLQETLTVNGQSPVVDVSSTSASVAFTKEVLDAVPRGRDLQNIFAMAPGVTPAVPDVGGSTMAQRQNVSSYGVAAQPKLQVEGMNITMGADQNTAIYFNDNTLEEVQIKTSGNDAEVSVPGISMVAVMKSGGNDFHGTYVSAFESPKAQSSNLDNSLRSQGLMATSPLKSFYDVSADLGGRLVRDKLWFYGAYSRQAKNEGVLGFVSGPGPDGKYADGPLAESQTYLAQYAMKLSYQISKNNRLVYAWQRGTKAQPQNGASRFVPLESTRDYKNPTAIQKAELQSTLNSRTLLNIVGGYSGYVTDYDAARSYARADAPTRMDLETGLTTGSAALHQNKTRDRYQVEGSVSFFPDRSFGGKHELKTGGMMYRDRSSDGYLNNVQPNYILITDKINGVSGTPSQIQIYNTPVLPSDHEDIYAWYLKDTWRVASRVTVNLGLRWERQHSYLPAQTKPPARDFPALFPGGSFPYKEIGTWTSTVPRMGVAWDLGGKSVVKGSFGLYNYIFGDTFGDAYNTNATGSATFRWHDLNGDKLYEPGEVNLDPNGPDSLGIAGASSAVLNPNLKEPKTWESTASFERELAPALGFRAMYVYRRLVSYFDTPGPNILRPFSVYDIPITRRDPGPDGILNTADDGGKVTFYDYEPAYFGNAFLRTQATNSPNEDRFHSMEFTVTRRSSGRWMGEVSYFVVKNHRWLTRTFNSRNDYFFPVDDTWTWAGNASGSYRLPWNVSISGFLQSKSGILGQRTYIFRRADPDGGRSIAQLNNVTLRLEPFGSRRLAAINILNLRANKDLSLGRGLKLGIDFDVFNVLNTNAPTAATFASGPTFGYVTGVIPARIARIAARLRF